MKIIPIKNSANIANFKGKMDIYDRERPFVIAHPDYHPDSTMEKFLGKYHDNRTGKIYFADPMEPITDEIKKEADYIVYDNEPAYPDVNEEISKNYFGSERVNYKAQFENIKNYYHRRELAGWADKAEAQYQQWQASECIRLYDKAGGLRYDKECLEDKINNIHAKIAQYENSIELTTDLIKQKEAELEIANATSRETSDSVDGVNPAVVGSTGVATVLTVKNLQNSIKKLNNRLEFLNKEISLGKSVLEIEMPKVNEIKGKLIPLFDELKHFYQKQGIKKF